MSNKIFIFKIFHVENRAKSTIKANQVASVADFAAERIRNGECQRDEGEKKNEAEVLKDFCDR